jgi:hypothetical protein
MMDLITNTFVLIATDCPVESGTIPTQRGETPTIPVLQHQLLSSKPYGLTLEELMLEVYLRREGLTKVEAKAQSAAIQEKLFGKSYPCMRASPLPKKFGWGVHYDESGKLAIYSADSKEYQRFASGKVAGIEVVTAMRTKRAE